MECSKQWLRKLAFLALLAAFVHLTAPKAHADLMCGTYPFCVNPVADLGHCSDIPCYDLYYEYGQPFGEIVPCIVQVC